MNIENQYTKKGVGMKTNDIAMIGVIVLGCGGLWIAYACSAIAGVVSACVGIAATAIGVLGGVVQAGNKTEIEKGEDK